MTDDHLREPLDRFLDRKVTARDGRHGEVVAVDNDPTHKPLIVQHDDGSVGYYHPDQLTPGEAYADADLRVMLVHLNLTIYDDTTTPAMVEELLNHALAGSPLGRFEPSITAVEEL